MSLSDRMWNLVDKVAAPVREQTTLDDAQSRLARADRERRDRIHRQEIDPETGKPLLWWDVVVSSLAGQSDVPIPWPGTDVDDVRKSFLAWLAENEWQTVKFWKDGAESELTFRSSWIAGFRISGKGRQRE